MSKLIVGTDEITEQIRQSYEKYIHEEDVLSQYLAIVKKARSTLAPEDYAAVEYELSALEKKTDTYVHDIMPQIHEMPIITRPMEPYTEAVSNIQQFIAQNEIPYLKKTFEASILLTKPLL